MKKMSKVIDDYLSLQNRTYTDLAKEIGVAKSTISNWISKDKELSIYTFAKIAYVISKGDKDQQEQNVISYLETLSDRLNINVKVAFAIAHLNDHIELMKKIYELCKNSDDLEMKRCGNIFELYLARLNGQNVREVYLKIEKARTISNKKNYDIEIFCDILSMLILCDIGDFGLIEGYKTRIRNNMELVTNIYLKNLYNFWVEELWSYSILRRNQYQEFHEQNQQLRKHEDLNFFPVMEALLNIRSGESYMFSDYKRSLYFFQRATNSLNGAKGSLKYKIALNDINFIRIVWWKDLDKIDLDNLHPAELALFLIKTGKNAQAIGILEKIRLEKGRLTALQTCYYGMAKDDILIIKQSIDMFKANNDFLYGKFAEGIYTAYTEKVR
ncbi:AimR family lysis-lysogeny pheromone receptor [Bacillus pseudomycoides]|uniref:AimR family lysis-lysogeny pheromone receptor n=1 Tax=Bacillus pseudomycoides TaxID=64104 RepID=UPI000BF1ACDE|nr:AimR family lysis-lysogeny pheromone receptor [Bacillus pseudomycoides]PEI44653.1 transcriptional regulator [Bacillus pseudomycoides]PEK70472.1 transcriptional regulator [Bacillus pseudomycoides]PFW93866.1 transcriptional regulator [Bacillus pseudomycoides]PFX37587.1 transcriptional regulator [Bacillus pseudomycoides]PFY13853.1 transcriptional regulator [Bacillus pseudomycoides]